MGIARTELITNFHRGRETISMIKSQESYL